MSVIDKIVIYGVPNPQRLKLSEVLANKITVTTLELYSNPEGPNDDQFHKIDFEMWAYPDGIKIYNNYLQILNDSEPEFTFFEPSDLLPTETANYMKLPPQYLYSFVLTDYNLNRTYCTCIIWNERYFITDDRDATKANSELTRSMTQSMSQRQKKIFFEPKQSYSLAVPKCKIQTMINNPLILDTNTTLVYVPKAMIVCSKTPCLQFQRGLLKYYYKNALKQPAGKQKNIIKIPRIIQNNFNELIKNYGYPKAQTIFNQEKSETVKKIQLKLLKNSMKYVDKDRSWGLISVETSKLKDFFISTLFTIPFNEKGSYILTESGQTIGSRIKSDTVFHLPKTIDLFGQKFQKQPPQLLPLPIPQLIQLWKCLLLQKQILIFSNSQQQSILLCQLMLYLIQPIKWQNIYIPFLPFHLAHHIDAIGGYLIGMSRIHMDYMLEKFDVKTKVVVDLQHRTILEEGGKQVIELPQSIQAYLQTQLKKTKQCYQQLQKPSRSLITYLITNPQQAPKQHPKFLETYIKSSLQMQKTFFNALVVLFNNFIPFITKKDDGIIAVQTEEYLGILDDQRHRNFMREISKTMVFIRLCQYHVEESERCAWVQKNLGQLFVYSHDILSHKFVVSQQPQKNNPQTQQQPPKKRAYAWPIQHLLQKSQKYNQYIEYLFQKNLKQLLTISTTIQMYLTEQQTKYKILTSDDQFESFDLESIQIPSNFGKKGNKANSTMIRQKDQEQYRNIYQQVYSQVVVKASKNRKYGDKDQEQVYEEFGKICADFKIEKYLVKYIKYMELNYPENLVKLNAKLARKQNKKNGILTWLWDMINPPDSTRQKQQSQIKTKLQRKMTIKNIKTQSVLNLKFLFRTTAPKSKQIPSTQKIVNDKQLEDIKESEDNQSQFEKEKQRNQRKDKFIESIKQKGQRPSQTQSDMIL